MITRLSLSLLILSVGAFAEPSFEVASLKASSNPGPEIVTTNPGTLTMRNITLRRLISWAWEAPRAQVSGPSWLEATQFDVAAKASDAASEADMRLMMRSLLAERLGVRLHDEKRELPVYYLTLAKNGPRLHQASAIDPTQLTESVGESQPRFGKNKGMLTADHVSMGDVAEQLSEPLQRPVIDRTGMKGRYDIRLDRSGYMVPNSGDDDPVTMILTALPVQLGIKVESGRDTVTFWIVDAANKTPVGN